MTKKKKIPDKFQIWIDARKKFHLSHAHIQMARELGMNPKKFGGLANNNQEQWKLPIPQFIEDLCLKKKNLERAKKLLPEGNDEKVGANKSDVRVPRLKEC